MSASVRMRRGIVLVGRTLTQTLTVGFHVLLSSKRGGEHIADAFYLLVSNTLARDDGGVLDLGRCYLKPNGYRARKATLGTVD